MQKVILTQKIETAKKYLYVQITITYSNFKLNRLIRYLKLFVNIGFRLFLQIIRSEDFQSYAAFLNKKYETGDERTIYSNRCHMNNQVCTYCNACNFANINYYQQILHMFERILLILLFCCENPMFECHMFIV